MMTHDQIRGWLRSGLQDTGLTIAELSRRSGVNKATIYRAMKDGYEFVPSTRTMEKLNAAIMGAIRDQSISTISRSFGPVGATVESIYDIRAGIPETDDWPSYQSPFLYSQEIAEDLQFAGRISDHSANKIFNPGDFVHGVFAKALDTVPLKPGDFVVVARRPVGEKRMEFRIDQVIRLHDRGAHLEAPTTLPSLHRELDVKIGEPVDVDGNSYAVLGIIVAHYRIMHRLAG